jgi:membrane protease subunit (stomatin/prohibitin family)
MGDIATLGGKLIDNLEWIESPQSDVLAWRFPRYQNEIRMGAKLVVRVDQNAVFGYEGRLADVFQPGTYRLETANLPILKTLMGWKHGFHSPFNANVYFVSMRQWTDLKWSTADPIMKSDPEMGDVRIRAFGTYALQVTDPKAFLEQWVFTDPSFETVHSPQKQLFDISGELQGTIVSEVGDVIRADKTSLFDLADRYEIIGNLALETIGSSLTTLGLALRFLRIDNVLLPAEVEQARHTRTTTGVLRDMKLYSQSQNTSAINDAAKTPGESPGAGTALGKQMETPMKASGGPTPSPALFFVAVNGTHPGPYPIDTLAEKARNGSLARETLVWREGMAEWTPAGDVPELQPLFSAVPPARQIRRNDSAQ